MAYSHEEAATVITKEIFLKLMENQSTYSKPGTGVSPPIKGTDLATHVGECFEALLKKVMHAVKEA